MTDSSNTTETESTFDPWTVADRAGVDYAHRTYVHETTDHCEADAAGRVVVGVTDERGAAVLMVDPDRSVAVFPNETLGPDEEWLPTARRVTAEATGLDVTIDDPVRIRRVEHTTEDDDRPHAATVHVVFEATPQETTAEPAAPDDVALRADWFDSMPFEPVTENRMQRDARGDIQSVLGSR